LVEALLEAIEGARDIFHFQDLIRHP